MAYEQLLATVTKSPGFKVVSEESISENPPRASFVSDDGGEFSFREYGIQTHPENGRAVAEISTADIGSEFFERQEYEVEAGRKMVPELYRGIYDITVDGNFPLVSDINTLSSGVTFEQRPEGGEVKWVSVESSGKTLRQLHHAVGLRYTEEMFIYNQTWLFPGLERDFGAAHNALLNDIHLSPILDYAYTASNQTDGTAITDNMRATDPDGVKILVTLGKAIADSADDTANPRNGPYWILASVRDAMRIQNALSSVAWNGITVNIPEVLGVGTIQGVIAYNGWTGTRGRESVSYSGVSNGTAYLVHTGHSRYDFISRVKQPLRRQSGGADITRFYLDSVVWDTRFGVFSAPERAVQEITLPTSTSGGS